jgi:hypothetical protein
LSVVEQEAKVFFTQGGVARIVKGILRQAGGFSGDTVVNLEDLIAKYADCSLTRLELQLDLEKAFDLKFTTKTMLQLCANTTVADVVRYARIRIAKNYSEEQLYDLIRFCFGKLVQVTPDQLSGLSNVNSPIIDSLGSLDETDWSEWRREIMLRLPINVPEGFCRNTPLGLLYFVSCELVRFF